MTDHIADHNKMVQLPRELTAENGAKEIVQLEDALERLRTEEKFRDAGKIGLKIEEAFSEVLRGAEEEST